MVEGSARRNTQHSQQTPMPPAGLELAIPASERLQTQGAATGIGVDCLCNKLAVLGSTAV
jgi:hypothetical protein